MSDLLKTLTPAELRHLRLYLEGYSHKDRAKVLCVAPCTAKTIMNNIRMKLGLVGEHSNVVYKLVIQEILGNDKYNRIQEYLRELEKNYKIEKQRERLYKEFRE